MRSILCYGDSNTWGFEPATGQRYPFEQRWTGLLANALKNDCRIIEAGLCGRTTVFDVFYDPVLSGVLCIEAELRTHAPLDMVILMLGTNDLQFGHTAWEASCGAGRLVKLIRGNPDCFTNKEPHILLVSPIHIGEAIKSVNDTALAKHGHEESLRFASFYSRTAAKHGIDFLDGGVITELSPLDCVHMDGNGHELFSQANADKIRRIFG